MARKERRERKGRGRLSTIDLLPEECDADIVWANQELRAGKRLQIDILEEFNARLADRGVAPIAKSSFSRYSVRKAQEFRELDERRRISAEVVQSLGTSGTDELTIALSEAIKIASFRVLNRTEDVDPKALEALGRANQAAVSAQKMSAEYRRKLVEEVKAKAVAAVDRVAKSKGLTKDIVQAIRQEVLGVKLG